MIQKIMWGILLVQALNLGAAQRPTAFDEYRQKPWFIPVQDEVQNFVRAIDRDSLQQRRFPITNLQQVIQSGILTTGHHAAADYDSAVHVVQESLQAQVPERIAVLKEESLTRAAQANEYPLYPDLSISRFCAQEFSDVSSAARSASLVLGTVATGLALTALRFPQVFKTGYEMAEARAKYIALSVISLFGLWRLMANIAKNRAFEVDAAVIEWQLGGIRTDDLIQHNIIHPLQQNLTAQRTAARVDGLVAQVGRLQSDLSVQGRRGAVIHREVVAGRQENQERFRSVARGVGCVDRRVQELARSLGMSIEEVRVHLGEQVSRVGHRVDGIAEEVAGLHSRLDQGAAALRGMEDRLRGDIVRAVVAVSGLSSTESAADVTRTSKGGLVDLVLRQMIAGGRKTSLPDSSRPEKE